MYYCDLEERYITPEEYCLLSIITNFWKGKETIHLNIYPEGDIGGNIHDPKTANEIVQVLEKYHLQSHPIGLETNDLLKTMAFFNSLRTSFSVFAPTQGIKEDSEI
jgi:hypothetical protein